MDHSTEHRSLGDAARWTLLVATQSLRYSLICAALAFGFVALTSGMASVSSSALGKFVSVQMAYAHVTRGQPNTTFQMSPCGSRTEQLTAFEIVTDPALTFQAASTAQSLRRSVFSGALAGLLFFVVGVGRFVQGASQ